MCVHVCVVPSPARCSASCLTGCLFVFVCVMKSSPGAKMNMKTSAQVSPEGRTAAAAARKSFTDLKIHFAAQTTIIWMENGT